MAVCNETCLACHQVLCHDFHSNLHTGAPHVVHFTMHRHDVPNIGGCQEIKAFNTHCYHMQTCMLRGNDSRCLISHTHNDSAVHIAVHIGIHRLHHARR